MKENKCEEYSSLMATHEQLIVEETQNYPFLLCIGVVSFIAGYSAICLTLEEKKETTFSEEFYVGLDSIQETKVWYSIKVIFLIWPCFQVNLEVYSRKTNLEGKELEQIRRNSTWSASCHMYPAFQRIET